MKEPLLSDDAFLHDVQAAVGRPETFDLWWLGQSGFLIHCDQFYLLIDPYLSDSLTSKYAGTDKPHVRVTRRVVDPAALARRLRFIQVVTSSHAHTDHLDPDTLRALVSSAVTVDQVIAPKPVLQLAYERFGAGGGGASGPRKFVGLDEGESHDCGFVRVTAVASAHETVERDASGHCKFLGYVFEFDPRANEPLSTARAFERKWSVYHSGDTVAYDGLVERLKPFDIDVAMLPINGSAPERRVAGNLSGREAARLAKDIGAKLAIPCHYDMFEFNTADPYAEFVPECERIGQRFRVLGQGERWSSSELVR